MSTSALVRTAFEDNVFNHADVTEFSATAYAYEITDASELELGQAYEDQRINFFEYLVGRSAEFGVTGAVQYNFTVEIRYYIEAQADQNLQGENWKKCVDAFDAIFGVLITTPMKNQWDDTVDYWNPPTEPPAIQRSQIGGRDVWQAVARYTAVKSVSI